MAPSFPSATLFTNPCDWLVMCGDAIVYYFHLSGQIDYNNVLYTILVFKCYVKSTQSILSQLSGCAPYRSSSPGVIAFNAITVLCEKKLGILDLETIFAPIKFNVSPKTAL